MSDLNQANGPLPSPEEQVRKYRTIAEDLDRIARGWHPTESELHSAPILRAWRMIEHPVPHLIGTVSGHPRLPDGPIRTSVLLAYDPDRGYARTFSRFYRLESPSPEEGGFIVGFR